MPTDAARNIGVAGFGDCLKENALGLRIGFDRGTVVIDDMFECIKDISFGSARDALLQCLEELGAKLIEYGQEEPFFAAEVLIEHWLGYFAGAGQHASAGIGVAILG